MHGCRSCGECKDCSVNVDAESKVYKQEHAIRRGHIDLLDERTLRIMLVITTRSQLRKVLFLAPSVCVFCLCMKYLGNR